MVPQRTINLGKLLIHITNIFNNICRYHPTVLINPLNAELNPISHLLALLGAHHILHVSRIRVNDSVYIFSLTQFKFYIII